MLKVNKRGKEETGLGGRQWCSDGGLALGSGQGEDEKGSKRTKVFFGINSSGL